MCCGMSTSAVTADLRTTRNSKMREIALLTAAIFLLFLPAAHAQSNNRNTRQQPAHDPGAYLPRLAPLPQLRAPSPGNSEAGSPVRGYIYAPPPDNGAVLNRLIPPSTTRTGPYGY